MKILLKLLITLLLFVLIFRHTNVGAVLAAVRGAEPLLILLGVLAQFCSTLVASFRWFLMMHILAFPLSYPFYLRSYFKGSFFNQGLPTSIGGDALRVLDVARQGFRKRDAFVGVAIDRAVGLTGLLLLNLLANVSLPNLLPARVFWAINAVTLGSIAAVGCLPLLRRLRFLEHGPWWLRMVHDLSERFATIYRNPAKALGQLGLSLTTHVFTILAIYSLGRALGMHYSLGTFMVIVPPVLLLTLVPISLAGWGVREGAMIGLFLLVHGNHDVVLSMSILYGVTLVVTSLPGLQVYLAGKHGL